MKKILMAIVAVLFAAPSFAQYSSGGFSLTESSLYYGIRLGANFAGISDSDLGTKTGFNLGGVVGLRVSEVTPIFLESGLYFTQRGAKKDETSVGLSYVEIPLLLKYGVQATDDIAVLPYVGPYFSLGVGGKYKFEDADDSGKPYVYKESSYDTFKRGDFGFKIGCGAEYNKLYLELGYQFGVTNIAKDVPGEDPNAKNHALYVNIGVNF